MIFNRLVRNSVGVIGLSIFFFSSCSTEQKIEDVWSQKVNELSCSGDSYNVAIISKVDCSSCESKLEEFFQDPSFQTNTLFVCEDTRDKEIMYWEKQYPFFKNVQVIYSSALQKYLMDDGQVLTTLQVRNRKDNSVQLSMTYRELMANPKKMMEIKGCI